ncbi:MAG TPA: hypothetical protein ENI51_08350, partial [Candidatus Atribacteria bacterium]|nr:hypothetical protein [Candidatus Atribacteria bacterium]
MSAELKGKDRVWMNDTAIETEKVQGQAEITGTIHSKPYIKSDFVDREETLIRHYADSKVIEIINRLCNKDLLIISLGSDITTRLAILKMGGICEAICRAKERGVKSIFIFNPTVDLESLGHNIFSLLKLYEDSLDYMIDDLFYYLIFIKERRIDKIVDLINRENSQLRRRENVMRGKTILGLFIPTEREIEILNKRGFKIYVENLGEIRKTRVRKAGRIAYFEERYLYNPEKLALVLKRILKSSSPISVNENIFRANDIRGIADRDLEDEVVFSIGYWFGIYLKEKLKKEELVVNVARDCRLSSERIHKNVIKGLISAGINVNDLGFIPTGALYYSAFYLKSDGAIMITASHNPKEYNGLKLLIGTRNAAKDEIQEIKELVLRGKMHIYKEGKVERINILPVYIEILKKRISFLKGIKIAIDSSFGAVRDIPLKVLKGSGIEVAGIHIQPNGNFPYHLDNSPDPSVSENLKKLIKIVKEKGLDAGFKYDGDGDRVMFVTNEGELVPADMMILIFSKKILEN